MVCHTIASARTLWSVRPSVPAGGGTWVLRSMTCRGLVPEASSSLLDTHTGQIASLIESLKICGAFMKKTELVSGEKAASCGGSTPPGSVQEAAHF